MLLLLCDDRAFDNQVDYCVETGKIGPASQKGVSRTTLDMVMDSYLELGFCPFCELGFMPKKAL